MFYGRQKYENIQDTAPAKVLSGLVLLMLNGHQADTVHMRKIACDYLGLEHAAECELPDELVLKGMVDTFLADKCDIHKCEPVFLNRANTLSIKTIEYWIKEARASGVSSDRIKSAETQLERMKMYVHNVY